MGERILHYNLSKEQLKMKIVDKYLIKEFLKPYILSIFLFIFLFLIFGLFDDLPSLLRRGETIPFSRYLLQAPFVFVQLSPLAVLCALLLTFGTLNKYNELFGLRTSGISLYRIILPFLFLGLFISLFSSFTQGKD